MPIAIVPENEEHWLQLRSEDVTSTEVAALFDLSPYMTVMELHYLKSGKKALDFEETNRIKWGRRLEAVIAKGVADDLKLDIRKVNRYMRHSDVPRMGSSFDFEIVNNERGPGILEIKNVDGFIYRQSWQDNEAPEHIEIQVQHQLEVADREWAMICPLVGGNEAKPFIRMRDRAVGEAIRNAVSEFWRMVDAGEEPKPDYERDAEFIISLHQAAGDQVLNTQDQTLADLLKMYKEAGAAESAAEKHKQAIKAQILDLVGDSYSKVLCSNFTLSCGFTSEVPPTVITPDMVGQTYGGRKGFRNFRVTEKKS